jgi:hypothetical protein
MASLSEEYQAKTFNEKIEVENQILQNIENKTKWSLVKNQHRGSLVDFANAEGEFIQLYTDYKMIQTGNAWIEIDKLNNCKNQCKWWVTNKPKTLETPEILYIVEIEKLQNLLNTGEFETKSSPNGGKGYIIPEWRLTKIVDQTIHF